MKGNLASRRILLFFFTSLSLVFADNVDNALRYRQIVPKGTGASASSTSAVSIPTSSKAPESITSSAPASDTPESSVLTSSTPDPVSTSTPPTEEKEEEPSTTLVPSDTSDAASKAVSTSEIQSVTDSTPSPEKPSTTPVSVPPASTNPASSVTQIIVSTVVFVKGGTSVTSTMRTTSVLQAPDSASASKGAPKLDGNDKDSGSSGMKASDKRVIIGTVVGIGGAILFGGIAVVVWRVWGKRKQSTEDDRDLMDSQPGSSGREKRSSVSGNSPFRSTLDQYHNPAGPVNTASNF